MALRALGAVFALLAALAFVTALAGGAAPTVVPGWWDGHPRIEGRVFERKDLHIGLITAYGCNRGETIKCQPLETKTARVSVGYIELGVLAFVALTAVALMRSTWRIDDRRKTLGKALLIQAAVAALGGVVVLALGPQIKVAQRFEVPIGVGVVALWTGVAFALVAAVIAIRLAPEPLRLRSSQAHNIPPEPMPAPVQRPASAVPDPAPRSDPPTLPRPGAAPSRPPPIPASVAARDPAATSAPSSASTPPSPPPPLQGNPAASAEMAGNVESTTEPAAAFGRGTIPPPLSAISFWSQPPTAPVPPGVLPATVPSAGIAAPPPVPPTAAPTAPFAGPPPIPTGPPAIPPPRPSAPSIQLGAPSVEVPRTAGEPGLSAPRPMAPSLPTIIHAVPPPPSAVAEPPPLPADHPTTTAAFVGDAVVAAPNSPDANPSTRDATGSSDNPNGSGEGPITATLVAVTPAPTSGSAGVETGDEPTVDPTSPRVEVPISTAPASLPPPKKAAPTNSELSPACPQCEAGMTWVDEHLRFYCGQCRMYF